VKVREGLVREARRLFGEDVAENEALARHCSFRIGGEAALFLRARQISALRKALAFCRENSVPFVVLGRGTNVLVPDSRFEGMVIGVRASGVQFEGKRLVAEAGASLQQVAEGAVERGLAGMEFCIGIPGSVGGAVIMNAGAHGGCIGDLVEEVTGFDPLGGEVRFGKGDLRFGYRESSLQEFPGIVATATLGLDWGDSRAIREKMDRLWAVRRKTQPTGVRCAGSVFRNPPDDPAGKLIELAGCKGMRRGGAAVSRKHANFIVNRGGASYSDVKGLIEAVRERVRMVHGVELELEIIDLGEKACTPDIA
jgi:UDP-N-acetylmuramate dehydrogenase